MTVEDEHVLVRVEGLLASPAPLLEVLDVLLLVLDGLNVFLNSIVIDDDTV